MMKRIWGAVVVIGIALWAGPASAACSINTLGLNFGAYDVYATTPLDSAMTGTYSCDTPALVHVGTGSSGTYAARTMRNGTNVLNYNIYIDPARTTVAGPVDFPAPAGTNVPFQAYGRVFAGQDVSVGSYSDTIVVVFNF
jgi:spore coat protein U-like protein